MSNRTVAIVTSLCLCILVQTPLDALTFSENWQTAAVGDYVPTEGAPARIRTGSGIWIVEDTASMFEAQTPNRAQILAEGSNRMLKITTVDGNMWVALDPQISPVSIPVREGDRLAITIECVLEYPQWNGYFPTLVPPPGDCVYLQLTDDKGSTLIYMFNRAASYTAHTETFTGYDFSGKRVSVGYHEVLVGAPDALGRNTYVLDLYEDFCAVPGFAGGGKQIKGIQFEITSIGWVVMDDLKIGNDIAVQAPSIVQQPQSQMVKTGDRIELAVVATGSQPFDYQWYHDGESIAGANSNAWVIESATLADAGSYAVSISNAQETISSDVAEVFVFIEPTITQQPQNQTALLDSHVQVAVAYEANGTVQVQWFKDDAALDGANRPVLHIWTLTEQDVGAYHVEITNEIGSVTSETVEIRAIHPATVTREAATGELVIDGRGGHAVLVETSSDGAAWRPLDIVDLIEDSARVSPGDSNDVQRYRATAALTGIGTAAADTAAIYGYTAGDAEQYLESIIDEIGAAIAETQVWLNNVDGEYIPKVEIDAGYAYLTQDDGLSHRYGGQVMGYQERMERVIVEYWFAKVNDMRITGPWYLFATDMLDLTRRWCTWATHYYQYFRDQELHINPAGAIFETPSEIRNRRISLWTERIALFEEEKELLRRCMDIIKTPDVHGRLSGIVWHDQNRNGAQEAYEPALPGIELWIDEDLNLRRDEESVRFEAGDLPVEMPDWFGFHSHTKSVPIVVAGVEDFTFTTVLEVGYTPKGGARFTFGLRNAAGRWHGDIALTYSEDSGLYTGIVQGMDYTDPNGTWRLQVEDKGTFTNGGTVDSGAITLRTNWEQSIITSADGTFSVDGLGPGIHVVGISLPEGLALAGDRHYCLGLLNLGVMDDVLLIPLVTEAANGTGTPSSVVGVHRLWSATYRRHFYTIDLAEKDAFVQAPAGAWEYEDVVFQAFADANEPGLQPVYRFYSEPFNAYLYTISESEKDKLINKYADKWTYETVAFYAYPEGAQPAEAAPVHRFWSETFGCHFYTIDEREKNKLINEYASVWTYEGVVWYAYL